MGCKLRKISLRSRLSVWVGQPGFGWPGGLVGPVFHDRGRAGHVDHAGCGHGDELHCRGDPGGPGGEVDPDRDHGVHEAVPQIYIAYVA